MTLIFILFQSESNQSCWFTLLFAKLQLAVLILFVVHDFEERAASVGNTNWSLSVAKVKLLVANLFLR